MPEELRLRLLELGLSPRATEQEAWAFFDSFPSRARSTLHHEFFGHCEESLRDWVTLDNGVHIDIGADGTIEKGPAALKGSSPSKDSAATATDKANKASKKADAVRDNEKSSYQDRAGAHREAQKAHQTAAKEHEAKGNKREAKAHQAAARQHQKLAVHWEALSPKKGK